MDKVIQTNIAQTIDLAADKARYDEYAKKLLSYKVNKMCNLSEGLIREGMEKGMEKGREKGLEEGENKLADLINRLLADNRQDDIARVTSDENVRRKMYEEQSGVFS
jgi:flagellar biosynthesis/type III secretory pathway protein FliH